MSNREGENNDRANGTDEGAKPTNKVARLIEEYDIGEDFGDELERLWTTDSDKQESLRSLAEIFNKRLLEEAMVDAGMGTIDGEVDNIYRVINSDDVSSGSRIEARNRLKQEGIDVDQLEKDFVTYQAIRSYLKDYRGVEYNRGSDEPRTTKVKENIQRLKSRVHSVASNSLKQLRDNDHISLEDFRVFVEINVVCEECGHQYQMSELLENGGCDCQQE